MAVERVVKPRFTVIGIEGSTEDGDGFIQRLWGEANARFPEIQHLCAREEDGTFAGFWGAMTDFTRSFRPWEDFSRGRYLAGAECVEGAEPPEGGQNGSSRGLSTCASPARPSPSRTPSAMCGNTATPWPAPSRTTQIPAQGRTTLTSPSGGWRRTRTAGTALEKRTGRDTQ